MASRWKLLVLSCITVLAAAVVASSAAGAGFVVTPLVSSNGVPGTLTDTTLVNAWGLDAGPATPWWVNDNGNDVSTLYTGAGAKIPLTVGVSPGPTGLVFNGTGAFHLKGGDQGAAAFIFDGEGGTITAWNRSLGTTAETELTSQDGAVYKGLAIAQTSAGPRLYATDFENRRVDMFDGSWQPVSSPLQFLDPTIPSSFAPFGIQAIGDRVYVTYAKTQPGSEDEAHGLGLGFVDAFDAASGRLVGKIAAGLFLNAPWGIAQAPPGFGLLPGTLLVGNFGDGRINAYLPILGGAIALPLGPIRSPSGMPVTIDGLWALEFGRGGPSGPTGTLFFTAGPDDESEGLFGKITTG